MLALCPTQHPLALGPGFLSFQKPGMDIRRRTGRASARPAIAGQVGETIARKFYQQPVCEFRPLRTASSFLSAAVLEG